MVLSLLLDCGHFYELDEPQGLLDPLASESSQVAHPAVDRAVRILLRRACACSKERPPADETGTDCR